METKINQLIKSCYNDFDLASRTIERGHIKGNFTEDERNELIDILAEKFLEYVTNAKGVVL